MACSKASLLTMQRLPGAKAEVDRSFANTLFCSLLTVARMGRPRPANLARGSDWVREWPATPGPPPTVAKVRSRTSDPDQSEASRLISTQHLLFTGTQKGVPPNGCGSIIEWTFCSICS
jgi:hypothetical protein